MTDPSLKTTDLHRLPIGVFDSGLGGLTVVKQLVTQLPHEKILYFGDTARVPYGSKGAVTVQKFSRQIARFLFDRGVKMIVVACNTASSYALEILQTEYNLPLLGVLEPGARAALRVTRNQRVGVIGTTATIAAGKYPQILHALAPDVAVFSKACPLFVPLVEEGWLDSPVTELVAREYLSPLLQNEIDTLILGCTHYPLLKNVLQRVVASEIQIVDTALETANQVRQILQGKDLLAPPSPATPEHQYFVSDVPQKFEELAERFLGAPLKNVTRILFDDCS